MKQAKPKKYKYVVTLSFEAEGKHTKKNVKVALLDALKEIVDLKNPRIRTVDFD